MLYLLAQIKVYSHLSCEDILRQCTAFSCQHVHSKILCDVFIKLITTKYSVNIRYKSHFCFFFWIRKAFLILWIGCLI